MPAKVTVTVKPDLSTLEIPFKKGLNKNFLRRRIGLLATDIRTRIQKEAPRRSGNLRKAILQRKLGDVGQQIYVDTRSKGGKYEFFYRAGTKPHKILPRTKKALFWPGASHPVKMVNHPGFKGDDYWTRGINKSTPAINKAVRDIEEKTEKELIST